MSDLIARAKRILDIDKHALDKEWVLQPKLYFEFAAELVGAREQVDKAKANLELVEAELDKAVRLNPERFGVLKITEATVHNQVIAHERYMAATRQLTEARYEAGVLQAAVEALDHRKKALENLVHLHAANYFAEPRAPTQASREDLDHARKHRIRTKGAKT